MMWLVLAIVTGLGLGGGIAYGWSVRLDARRTRLPIARVVTLGAARWPADWPDDDCPECGAVDADRAVGVHHATHCSGYLAPPPSASPPPPPTPPTPPTPPPDQYGANKPEPGTPAVVHALNDDETRVCDGGPVTRVYDASYLYRTNPLRRCRMPACRRAWDARLAKDIAKRKQAAEDRKLKADRT